MKKNRATIKYIFIAVWFLSFVFVHPVLADPGDLEVVFENTPLFSEANFLPGEVVERFVEVTNNSTTTKDVKVEAINASNINGLGDAVTLRIEENTVELYNDTFTNFFAAGEVFLSQLAGASTTTQYDFFAVFDPIAGNQYQSATMSFDLVVGFMGENGESVIDGGGATLLATESSSNGGGGGGGGPISDIQPLQIFNEKAGNIDPVAGSTDITWDTSLLASSRVVFGLEGGGPYSLDLEAPNFGYPMSTTEDFATTIGHSVELFGLPTDETYLFRVVSRTFAGALPTISIEQKFTLAPEGFLAGALFTLPEETSQQNGSSPSASVPGIQNTITTRGTGIAQALPDTSTGNSGRPGTGESEIEISEEENKELERSGNLLSRTRKTPAQFDASQLAGAVLGIPVDFWNSLGCVTAFLLVLIIVILLWLLWSFKNRNKYPESTQAAYRRLYYPMSFFVVMVVAYALGHICVVFPFGVALIASVVWSIIGFLQEN